MLKAGRLLLAITLFLAASTLLAGCLTRQRYSLTIAVSGNGTVTPAGGRFAKGTVVTMTPAPSSGWTFAAWGGVHHDAVVWNDVKKAYSIFMDGDKNITAVFSPYPLSITCNGEGTVDREQLPDTGGAGQPPVTLRLTARPTAGWAFVRWEGADVPATADPQDITIDVVLDREKSITAVFARLRYDLNITYRGQGSVFEQVVSQAPTLMAASYNSGVTVRLTAEPGATGDRTTGWVFDRWEGDLTDATNPQTIVLDRDRNVVAVFVPRIDRVAPGWTHTLALTTSGAVYAWGANHVGELGDGTYEDRRTPVRVTGLLDNETVIAIAAGPGTGPGKGHSVALTQQRRVYAWGWNDYGQLGDGTAVGRNTPAQVINLPGADPIKAIAAGAYHTVALTESGAVCAWGDNRFGQLGNGVFTDRDSVVPTPNPVQVIDSWGADPVKAIAAGGYFTVALTEAGKVYTWGHNTYGQLGDGTPNDTNRNTPGLVALPGDPRVTAIAAGRDHVIVRTEGGSVYAWGANAYGQLGVDRSTCPDVADGRWSPTPVPYHGLPVPVPGLPPGITEISAGQFHTVALTGAGVYAWGGNFNGQLGIGTVDNNQHPDPVLVTGLPDGIITIAAGRESVMALTDTGFLYAWGYNVRGQLGDGTLTNRHAPVPVVWN